MRRPLYPLGNSPWYPLDRRLGGPQSQSGRSEEVSSKLLPGLGPSDHPARSPELYHRAMPAPCHSTEDYGKWCGYNVPPKQQQLVEIQPTVTVEG
jgi:hypothetical protein